MTIFDGFSINLLSTIELNGLAVLMLGDAGWNWRKYFRLRLATRPVPSTLRVKLPKSFVSIAVPDLSHLFGKLPV